MGANYKTAPCGFYLRRRGGMMMLVIGSLEPEMCPQCFRSGSSKLRKFIDKNGRDSYRYQCQECGAMSAGVKRILVHNKDDVPLYNQRLRVTLWDKETPKEKYQRYLQSDHWHDLRKRILRRARGKCERCADAPAAEVHHLTYQRLTCERRKDLIALCAECHRAEHQDKQL